MNRGAIIHLIAIFTAFHWSAGSCIMKPKSLVLERREANSNIPLPEVERSTTNNFALERYIPLFERNDLGKKIADASLVDAFFALSHCHCMPNLQIAFSNSINSQRGVLPQALTPAIRREILSNSKLKLLDGIPAPLDQIVGDIFASEEVIANQISNSLFERVKKAVPEISLSGPSPTLQLDAFPHLPGTKESLNKNWVQMVDVWSRWGLIFSEAGPWTSVHENRTQPIFMWHELLRVLAEAEYLYGIAADSDGHPWGGLTIPVDLQITHPGPFDPRKSHNQVRFLSGILDLTLPNNQTLTLARSGGERWSWRTNSVSLAEQALQWWVAAKMLNRLRPANRGQLAKYFLPDGLLPEESYQLALLVLPGIDALLGGRFIDENTRRIQSEISGSLVAGVAPTLRDKADPQTLSLLLMALEAWYSELSNTADLLVSSETESQLKTAPRSLQRGAQLIVQTLLNENLVNRSKENPDALSTAWTLTNGGSSPNERSLRDHAQVLVALIKAEQSILKSPYLRARITQLAVGLEQRMSEHQSRLTEENSIAHTIWIHSASALFAQTYPNEQISQKLSQQAADLVKRMNEFERSILQ